MDRQDDKIPEPTPPTATPLAIPVVKPDLPTEYGGRKGLEPTRYGDWEKGGIAVDF